MEWKAILSLGAITLVVIGLVIYFGVVLNKAVLRRNPETVLQFNITLTGTVLWSFVVGIWVVCVVAGKLRPGSSLGSFVGTADGMATVLVGSIFFAGVAGAVLEKVGYPIMKKGQD